MTPHPHLFVTSGGPAGLRSVGDVRQATQGDDHSARLWQALCRKVDREMVEEAWTPATPLPHRSPQQVKHANREYCLVGATANRILNASLVALVRDDRRYADAALEQVRSLYDACAWPEIEDKTHLALGDHCSLRRGQLAVALGLSYDWLHSYLSSGERAWFLDGFDTRFTRAFREALEAGDRWVNWTQNFIPVIYGGFGVAGMALGDDYKESTWLVETAAAKMDDYTAQLFGQEGEFNESVQYAGSTAHVVQYLTARRYAGDVTEDVPNLAVLGDFCRWYMYFTLPPGRVAGFGDPAPDMPPVVHHFSAVASALRDPVLQWFYLQYEGMTAETHRKRALELLYYDNTVVPESPDGRLPLGRAYNEQGRLVSSRSSWDPESALSVVYAKASREYNHSHADWGQVCLDGNGERLVVDLGSTPGYPAGDSGRYYNYQQWGHNVLVVGQNDTGGTPLPERGLVGSVVQAEFDDERGGMWTMDLSEAYPDALSVERKVVHLLPRVLVVLDEATLRAAGRISLRWHTLNRPEVCADGSFGCTGDAVGLAGRVERLDGDLEVCAGHHAYTAPHNRDRLGEVYEDRCEPYVEATATSSRCRLVSLFCVAEAGETRARWEGTQGNWYIDTPEGAIHVRCEKGGLDVRNARSGEGWALGGQGGGRAQHTRSAQDE